MPFDLFQDENLANKPPLASDNPFQVGVSNFDPPGSGTEDNIKIPVIADDEVAATWLYYECTIKCYLDSGIVVHRTLPQSNRYVDSLGCCDVADKSNASIIDQGVNLRSEGTSVDLFQDVVQRMAHSIFRFNLVG